MRKSTFCQKLTVQQKLDNYELGDRKLKFDWLDFINKQPKFPGFMNSKFIPEHD